MELRIVLGTSRIQSRRAGHAGFDLVRGNPADSWGNPVQISG